MCSYSNCHFPDLNGPESNGVNIVLIISTSFLTYYFCASLWFQTQWEQGCYNEIKGKQKILYSKLDNGNKDWCLMTVIPIFRSLRQKDCCEPDVELSCTMSFGSDKTALKSYHICSLYLVCIYFGCLIHQN